jgi:CRISPR-associated protein Csx17
VSAAAVVLERRIADLALSSQAEARSALLAVLAALGTTERALARSLRWTKEAYLHPLGGLSPRWLQAADDGSREFRLAAALAFLRAPLGKDSLWSRQHLEPLDMGSREDYSWAKWAGQPGNDVVWHDGDLVAVLNAILARRLVRFEKAGTQGWPDIAVLHASLDDITAFIEGRVNEDLLGDLLWGIACVDHAKVASAPVRTLQEQSSADRDAAVAPSALYALLKLCHHRRGKGEEPIPLVPAILHRAVSGDGKAASELATRRLIASGYTPLVKSLPLSGDTVRRTAASVLFPISSDDLLVLKQTICHKPKEQTA